MPIPELILQKAIINGIGVMRKDPKILNNLFSTLSVEQQEAVKSLILDKKIDFSFNYPQSDIKVPAIVLLLKTENESQGFLGDIMGAPPHYDMPDADMTVDTLGGSGASISNLGGLPAKLAGPLYVDTMLPNNNAITFIEASQDIINEVFSVRDSWPALNLHVVAGSGAGQVKQIVSITGKQLDIGGTFELELDSSSLIDIRYAENPESVYGEPIRAYANNTDLLRIGANYEGQYQLEVLAGNQYEVIYLYSVIKAILFSQRKFLESQGIMALKVSGTDLAPRTELLPDEVFSRSMTLQFTYPFEFIVSQEVARAIEITLTSVDPENNTPVPGSEIIVAEIVL